VDALVGGILTVTVVLVRQVLLVPLEQQVCKEILVQQGQQGQQGQQELLELLVLQGKQELQEKLEPREQQVVVVALALLALLEQLEQREATVLPVRLDPLEQWEKQE
jgi:hypothetical protein